MPRSLRMLSVLFWALNWAGAFGGFLIVLIIAWGPLMAIRFGKMHLLWWCGSGLILLILKILAGVMQYTVFIPERRAFGGDSPATPPEPRLVIGMATGLFDVRDGYGWKGEEEHTYRPVQIHWCEYRRRPVLALLTPSDLPEGLKDPVMQCWEASLWYPGSEVTVGWIGFKGQFYPGLRLEFPGRRVYVAFAEMETAEAYAARLRDDGSAAA